MVCNQKGYAIKELLILCAVLAVVFAIGIHKVSYAYQEVDNQEDYEKETNRLVYEAAKIYVSDHKEEFASEETFFYGSDLIESQYILDVNGVDIANVKIKVVHKADSEDYEVEIVK